MGDYFYDSDHCQRSLVDDGPHSGVLHPRTGAAEELHVGMALLQSFDET